jgi:hypothetical protein
MEEPHHNRNKFLLHFKCRKTLSLYGNFYYLINPREQNGVAFTAGKTPPRIDSLAGNIVNSVPDVYSFRFVQILNSKTGYFQQELKNEGIPVYDL